MKPALHVPFMLLPVISPVNVTLILIGLVTLLTQDTLLPSTRTSATGVVLPWPDCVPVNVLPARSSTSTVGWGPVGPLTTRFHVPSGDAFGALAGAAGAALVATAVARLDAEPMNTGKVSQPRTVDVDASSACSSSTCHS